jgi:hypothetical protein
LDKQLLNRHKSSDIHKLIEDIKSDKNRNLPLYLKLNETNENVVCSKVYIGKKIYGIILVTFAATEEKI